MQEDRKRLYGQGWGALWLHGWDDLKILLKQPHRTKIIGGRVRAQPHCAQPHTLTNTGHGGCLLRPLKVVVHAFA